jgi:hypothetical protein
LLAAPLLPRATAPFVAARAAVLAAPPTARGLRVPLSADEQAALWWYVELHLRLPLRERYRVNPAASRAAYVAVLRWLARYDVPSA